MFTVKLNGPNRIDIDFSGRLDRDEMRAALDELVSKSEGIEHGRMMYRVGIFQLPKLSAIGLELARLPGMFRLLGKFDRAAVLVDQKWIRTVSEIEGKLVPGLEIKAFRPSEEAAAEAWLVQG